MKVFIALLLFNLALALPNSPKVPKFIVQQDRSMSDIPNIDIVFPDGHEDRMILKRHYVADDDEDTQELNCNFLGHLEKDKDACLAVTGCPGQNMEFTIHSTHNIETNKYIMYPSGNVELVRTDSIHGPDIDSEEEYQTSKDRASGSKKCSRDDTSDCEPLPLTNELKMKVCIVPFHLQNVPFSNIISYV